MTSRPDIFKWFVDRALRSCVVAVRLVQKLAGEINNGLAEEQWEQDLLKLSKVPMTTAFDKVRVQKRTEAYLVDTSAGAILQALANNFSSL